MTCWFNKHSLQIFLYFSQLYIWNFSWCVYFTSQLYLAVLDHTLTVYFTSQLCLAVLDHNLKYLCTYIFVSVVTASSVFCLQSSTVEYQTRFFSKCAAGARACALWPSDLDPPAVIILWRKVLKSGRIFGYHPSRGCLRLCGAQCPTVDDCCCLSGGALSFGYLCWKCFCIKIQSIWHDPLSPNVHAYMLKYTVLLFRIWPTVYLAFGKSCHIHECHMYKCHMHKQSSEYYSHWLATIRTL